MAVSVAPPGPTEDRRPIRRALISVYDKSGLEQLARGLHGADVQIVSTGGSAALIAEAGIPVTEVRDVTKFPECLEGRVKTLHPGVHAGLLADTRKPDHLAQLADLDIEPFDLVVVNLYPFAATIASGADPSAIVENIDVGGPAMIRAAAKNHPSVTVVVEPAAYGQVVTAASAQGFSFEERKSFAAQAFAHTASYDTAIATWMQSSYLAEPELFAPWAGASHQRRATLRYGENPHQRAALYIDGSLGVAAAEQLHGKEMSYNNYVDTDAALRAAYDHGDQPTVAIIKHANPCGIAIGESIEAAYAAAHACDPVSAFGGVIAANRPVSSAMAAAIGEVFTEVIVAPDFDDAALELLQEKKNLRILRLPDSGRQRSVEQRPITGGALVQELDRIDAEVEGGGDAPDRWRLVAGPRADESTLADLSFAWRAVRAVKSNAILLAREGAAVGIGMGQVNRVDSCHLAVSRANAGDSERARGAVAASDAFFPFTDGLQLLIDAGVRAVVAPGGSIRDAEVAAAAEAAGVTLYATGVRHFAH